MKPVRLFALALLIAQPLGACKRKGIESHTTGEGGSSPDGGPGSGGAIGSGGGGAGGGGAGAGGITGTGGSGAAGNTGTGGSAVACIRLAPITRRLWALSLPQYANATRDLLSLSATPARQSGPAYNPPPPFRSALVIDDNYLYALYQAAGGIATEIAPRASQLAACGAGETDTACAARFAQTFGRKTFRRVLESAEVADLMKVFATVCPPRSSSLQSCASPADFATAIKMMIKALILAPSFLYRTELGPRTLTANAAGIYPDTALTADEVATQLGFMLLDSTPDAGLLAAADSGSLVTPAGLLSEVNRLLALPVVRAHVTDMVSTWFGLDNLADKTKDPALLPRLPFESQDPAAIAGELRTSWDLFVADTLWTSPGGKVTDLLTSQKFFVNQRLATLYALPRNTTPAETFDEIDWPPGQARAGILTHPAFLWAASNPAQNNIVNRGNAVRDAIVCQDSVGPEPILTSAEAMAIVATGDSEATRSDARLGSGQLCADRCHAEIDPYGRLLHGFDAVGNVRMRDEAGRPIAPAATLTALSPLGAMTVSGPVAFAQAVVSSKVFAGCAVQRLFSASVDVPVIARDTCQVNDLRAQFDQSDGTISSLLRQLVLADFARARAGGSK